MPRSGVSRRCSLRAIRVRRASVPCAPGSTGRARATGCQVANRPTVEASWAPGTTPSSRPSFSTAITSWPTRSPRSSRQRAKASAVAVTRTSWAVPWTTAGTCSPRARVRPGSRVRSRWAAVSRAGSRRRAPSAGASRSSRARQTGASARRTGSVAASARPRAHCRKEVPSPGAAGGFPARTSAWAVARSAVRTDQEAVSTARWWATRSSRPLCPAPRSAQTARSNSPAYGSSWPTASAAAHSRAPSVPSTHSRTASAGGSAGSGMCRACRPGSPTRVARSTGWRSSTRVRAAVRVARVAPGGVTSWAYANRPSAGAWTSAHR